MVSLSHSFQLSHNLILVVKSRLCKLGFTDITQCTAVRIIYYKILMKAGRTINAYIHRLRKRASGYLCFTIHPISFLYSDLL
ncbi:hypothetical protein EVA_15678 [gut metagenome]|uniref:Uncharacterized protein n=1 Tax=gut metagenome TaxID=749906 RepID=J9G333_9ZZZZ